MKMLTASAVTHFAESDHSFSKYLFDTIGLRDVE